MKEIVKSGVEGMIYEVRGRQVMLDSDLAKLYECKNGTKEINQAVRNNPGKFPERFSWVLNDDELFCLRSKVLTAKAEMDAKRRTNPRVFTEQGVAMLATILKSKVATQVSIQIMDAFVAMRKYISSNLLEQKYINNMVFSHDERLSLLETTFSKFEEKKMTSEIYFNGQIYDAYSKIYEIFSGAKKELIIVDNYADKTLLDIIRRLKINVVIITKENMHLTEQDVAKYGKQYDNLKVKYNSSFHDRFFVLDGEVVYHCGASINRIGYKTFAITRIEDGSLVKTLLDKIEKL